MGEGLRVIVRVVGLEPTALKLKVSCSTTELHPQGLQCQAGSGFMAKGKALSLSHTAAFDFGYCSAFAATMQ